MRFRCFIGIMVLLALGKIEAATKAPCKFKFINWSLIGVQQTCEPDIEKVEEEDFTISTPKDSSTLALNIRSKIDVKFLPTNLFSAFPNLVAVQVYNCSVKSINENNFKNLSHLRILHLMKNKIGHIASNSFVDLVSLEILGLDYNRIRSLGKNTFASLKALKELFLPDNEIQALHPSIFEPLVNIKSLHLDNNEFHHLDENIFENLVNLEFIDLDHNQLRKITRHWFRNNVNLTEIWLRSNKIKFLDGDTFKNLPKLKSVGLKGNLCVNKDYFSKDFGSIKKYLMNECNENLAQEKVAKDPHFISINKNLVWLVFLFCIAIFFVVLILVVVYPPSRVFRHFLKMNPGVGRQN